MKTILAIIAALLLIGLAGATISDVKIAFPTNGSVYDVGTRIDARQVMTSHDSDNIISVLLINGQPANLLQPTKPGTYEIRGKATDKDGTVISAPVTIKIVTGIDIDMNRIPQSAIVGKPIKVSARVSFPGSAKCQLFINGVPALSSMWTPPAVGTYEVRVVVTDGYGNVETATTSIVAA